MSLRQTLESIRNQPTPPNEETAKFQIIAPVLKGLGWDPFSADVSYEHRVETAKGSGRVDIALRGETHTVAHIEAKAPGQDLNRHAKQAVGYAFDDGVDICALTTGLEWRLYLPRANRPHGQRRFTTLNLQDDPIDQLAEDLDTFLGKGNLLSGHSEHRATEVLEARRQADHLNTKLPEIWSRMVNQPDERLVELIVGQAYEELNLRPAAEQVKAVLRGSRVPAVSPPGPTAPVPPRRRPNRDSAEPETRRRSHRKPPTIVAYELWGQLHEVKTWIEMVVGVADLLHRRHGDRFEDILTFRGRTRTYASRRKEDILTNPRLVGSSGIWIEVPGPVPYKKRRAARLLEHFGHSRDDLRFEES